MRQIFENQEPVFIDSVNPNAIISTIEVSGLDGPINNVDVTLNINHSFTRDLVISLVGPAGQRALLVGREGGSGDNFEGTVFSEQAVVSIAGGQAPFSGRFLPEGSLAIFEDADPNGIWTLQISDMAFWDGGSLESWSLAIDVEETSPFLIQVRFLGGLTETQQNIFALAAARWSEVIIGDLPAVNTNIGIVDDVVIDAEGSAIDGPGSILGQAGPTALRPDSLLPARGIMAFDVADLSQMEANGGLFNVIVHEMGHVLGFGTLWDRLGLLDGAGGPNPQFMGANAMREYAALIGAEEPVPVPVANTGGRGTRDGHWRETVFGNELMTGFLNSGRNPLSRLSVAAMEDMGYQVNYNAADPFTLPTSDALIAMGILGDGRHHGRCTMMTCPGHFILPTEAVV